MSIVKKTKEKEKEMRLLILGLDNAGKTTIIKKFNGEDIDKISPTLGFNNYDRLSFFTRTYSNPAIWPDRLEVRFSKVGGTTADATATSVGDFTTLLLTVNAGLTTTG